MKKILNELLFYILYGILWLYGHTWRFEVRGASAELLDSSIVEHKSLTVALWHNSMLGLLFRWLHHDAVLIISQSSDGELIARALNKLGFITMRGSSTRGGIKALLGMSKLVKKGSVGAITVDGPKGPRHSVKPGVIFVAKQTGTPIVPVFMTCKHAKVFNSWDKYILPAPFSKIDIFATEPVLFDADTSEEAMERDRAALEKIMIERTREYTPDYI